MSPAVPISVGLPTPVRLPRSLLASAPGWSVTADVIVVGSGVAGLTVALHARDAGLRVLIVTKAQVDEGSTRWAQGGIAAALDPEDSPADHMRDTLVAGAGLCDPEAVRVLVTEGPAAVRTLIDLGARFDRDDEGVIELTREGGHLHDRIAHAGGDATGAEISRALVAAVARDPGIELVENALALDLLLDAEGATAGVTLHVMGAGQRDGVGAALAPAVVLATGGLGQVFSSSTNPAVATGDGVALALRAGADVADLEFVQFHPTVLWLGPDVSGQQPLVSEAVRGEGAVLVDDDGNRFMLGVHPLAELAPRDVVAKAIMRKMRETGSPHVWLDARQFGEALWDRRFPTILSSCRDHGIDPVVDLIPVAPAQHYASGGVLTDIDGRTSVVGLFACGESACTGVHGANRLASNSLLEGLVFAARIGAVLAKDPRAAGEPVARDVSRGLLSSGVRRVLQRAMTEGAGVLRSAGSLATAAGVLAAFADEVADNPCTETWENSNVHAVASVLAAHAWAREETRGSHWREDFPDLDDDQWRGRLVSRLDEQGRLGTRFVPIDEGSEGRPR
jgi:L-aspartate oxidase